MTTLDVPGGHLYHEQTGHGRPLMLLHGGALDHRMGDQEPSGRASSARATQPAGSPQVPHIGRFNLRGELARKILDAADVHLRAMAIPYALAIHDDFLRECIDLLVTARARTDIQAASTRPRPPR